MIKGQPKIGDKVVIRWANHPVYKVKGRSDLDICEIVTDGKRVFIEGRGAYNGKRMDAFKRKHCKTANELITAIGRYVYNGAIQSFHVRRKA